MIYIVLYPHFLHYFKHISKIYYKADFKLNHYIVKELLHYCNVNVKYPTRMKEEVIQYYDFTFVVKGEMTYIVDGKKYILREDDAIFIKPGSVRERPEVKSSAKYVSFNFTANDTSILPTKPHLVGVISHDIRKLISVFSASHLSNIYSTRGKVINLLNYILLEINDILEFDSNNKHIIEIIKYINEHISEPITLSSVSSKVNLSKEYTAHIFKEETGKTVTEYINERKLFIAKEMILGTNYPLEHICKRTGYDNYSYFSRVFKKQFDITPRDMRKIPNKK